MNHGKDRGIDGFGIDKRFIRLDIYNYVAVLRGSGFGHPVGTGDVVGSRHPDWRAETSRGFVNPIIISGNDRARDIPGQASSLIHVLEHALTCDFSENFSGEARGRKACRDDAQNFRVHRG